MTEPTRIVISPGPAANTPSGAPSATAGTAWGAEGFGFGAMLDIVNPLQHIPVIGTIYRAASGDAVSPAARVVGGALLGGPIGLVLAMVNVISEEGTGKDIGDHALAALGLGDDNNPSANAAKSYQSAQALGEFSEDDAGFALLPYVKT